MNIILASPEVSPFAKTGGLGDVAEILPLSLNSLGHNCSGILPYYKLVERNGYKPSLVKEGVPVKMGGREYKFDLLVEEFRGTRFYFIANDALYGRDGLYGTPAGDHDDNEIRFGLFSRAILASIPYIGKPDIIHCNDWQTGLVPMYLKTMFGDDEGFKGIKVLYSIHNVAYQGLFGKDILKAIDIPESEFRPRGLEYYGKVSFMKSGIVYSEAISTVSKGYKKEILTPEFGCGLEGLLKTRNKDFYGIINGADYDTWNPTTDKFIIKNYTADDLGPKLDCKKDLLKEFGIPFDPGRPLIGVITRLAYQKGVDIILEGMDELLGLGVNFVILGTGDEKYNRLFNAMNDRYRGVAAARVDFDNPLAHKIEAGSDMFLMPSRYEPCGLNQMYSMKYGTVPVARATGGLMDTVEDFDPATLKGNGFTFERAHTRDMLNAVRRAVAAFRDERAWRALQKNGLACDFSWEASAAKYAELYKKISENPA